MVVGFDVHHGGGKRNLASYYSTILAADRGMEMTSEIGNSLTSKFTYFKN